MAFMLMEDEEVQDAANEQFNNSIKFELPTFKPLQISDFLN